MATPFDHATPASRLPRNIGRYKILEVLSQSPSRQVYRVELDGQQFALKTFLSMRFADQESVSRFWQEVRVAQLFRSPNVVAVHTWGVWDDSVPYLVLELLEGSTLRAHVEANGPLGSDTAVDLLRQLLAGLDAIHAAGVVHRDLRPENLFWHRCETLKILDFGLARRPGAAGPTPTGTTVGADIFFMSPEQLFDAKRVDVRSDIFGAGVLFYYFLTGHSPITGATRAEALSCLANGAWRPITEPCPDLPQPLQQWLHTALQHDRDRRFPDTRAALQALNA